MSISSVDLSRFTVALLARLAVVVAGFNNAGVVVDPHFQVLGPQGSNMQLLQKIWHTWQVQRERLHIISVKYQ